MKKIKSAPKKAIPVHKFMGVVNVEIDSSYRFLSLSDGNVRAFNIEGRLVEIRGDKKGQRTFIVKSKLATFPVLERCVIDVITINPKQNANIRKGKNRSS